MLAALRRLVARLRGAGRRPVTLAQRDANFARWQGMARTDARRTELARQNQRIVHEILGRR